MRQANKLKVADADHRPEAESQERNKPCKPQTYPYSGEVGMVLDQESRTEASQTKSR